MGNEVLIGGDDVMHLLRIEARTAPPPTCAGRPVTVDLNNGEVPTSGADVILGTDGPDVIAAGAGDDHVCGNGGNDWIWGNDGADFVDGGPGADVISGGSQGDWLVGGGPVATVAEGQALGWAWAPRSDRNHWRTAAVARTSSSL